MYKKIVVNSLFLLLLVTTFSDLIDVQTRYYRVVVLDQSERKGIEGVSVGFFADGVYQGYAVTDSHGVALKKMKSTITWNAISSLTSHDQTMLIHQDFALSSEEELILIFPKEDK